MKLFVKAHPKAKKPRLVKKDESHYEVWVREVPEDGRANRAILEALSEELSVPKSALSVVSGQTSRTKVIAVEK